MDCFATFRFYNKPEPDLEMEAAELQDAITSLEAKQKDTFSFVRELKIKRYKKSIKNLENKMLEKANLRWE